MGYENGGFMITTYRKISDIFGCYNAVTVNGLRYRDMLIILLTYYTGSQISKTILIHGFLLTEFKSVARFPPSSQVSEIIDVDSIAYS